MRPSGSHWLAIFLIVTAIGINLPALAPYQPAGKIAWQDPRFLGVSFQQHWRDQAWYSWAGLALRMHQPLKLRTR